MPELVEEAAAKGISIQFIAAAGEPAHSRETIYPDLPDSLFWSLQLMGREPVFYDAHPSPRILREHGIRLAGEMARRGKLPLAVPAPTREDGGFPGDLQ